MRILGEDADVEEIRPLTFARLGQELLQETLPGGKTRSNGGVNRIMAALSTVLNWLYKNEMVSRKPAYTRLPEKKGRADFYSEDDMLKLYAASLTIGSDAELLHDSIMFAYYTGCRQGEMLKLKWNDSNLGGKEFNCVNFDERHIWFLDTKPGDDLKTSMSEHLVEMLRRRYRDRLGDREAVFPWSGKYALLRRFKKAKRIAGMDDDRVWHSIRHTTGTHLCEKGVPLRTVMGVLGHHNIETTLRYAKNTDRAVANAIDLL